MSETVTSPLGPQYSPREAAGYLGITVGRIRELIRHKKIRVLRDGRVRIYQRWCDDYVARLSTPVAGAVARSREPEEHQHADLSALMPATKRFARSSTRHATN